ncbi:50S ribosomal protein L1 [Deltaproteobacteria bacterium]|nr:50S ribosomal protein L1 [Deltaproteobacteria bacterium]
MATSGKRYSAARKAVDPNNKYSLDQAVVLLKQTASAKFDETIDIAVRLGVDPKHADQMVRGAVALPHGTGKTVRVLVFAQGEAAKAAREAGADFVGADDLILKIESEGWTDFDKAVATRDLMGKVGKLGRVLGPRGLMPNPKIGTVVGPDAIAQTVRELKGGKIDFRVEKAGIVHANVGRASMEGQQLKENIEALVNTLMKLKPASAKGTYLRGAAVSTTMGPGIRLDPGDLIRTGEA